MRLVGAALVTIFFFGIFSGALGFASASDDSIQLRNLWPGDAGAYNVDVRVSGAGFASSFDFGTLLEARFQAGAPVHFTEPSGAGIWTVPLQYESVDWLQGFSLQSDFGGNDEKVQEQWLFANGHALAKGGEGTSASGDSLDLTSETTWKRAYEFRPLPPCVFAAPGMEACELAAPMKDEATGLTWTEREAGVYEARGTTNEGSVSILYEFEPEIPFASRITIRQSIDTISLDFAWSLTGFEPGIPFVAPPATPGHVVWNQAPLQPWGLEDTGVVAPFLASQAFQGAQNDLLFTELRDFQQRYPNAKTVHAAPTSWEEDGGVVHQWTFVLSDGISKFGFTATHRELTLLPVVQYEEFAVTEPMPHPNTLPETAPTVRSLLQSAAAQRTLADAEGEEPVWFLDGTNGRLGAGFVVPRQDQQVPSNALVQSAAYAQSWDGQPLLMEESSTAKTTPLSPFSEPAPTSKPRPTAAAAWTFPQAEAAASAGFLAFVLGGLYYFWPALKQGIFAGLFSRVQGEQVLEHPARASIMEAVESNPGIHRNALERETGLKSGTLRHHLDILTSKGKLVSQKKGGFACYVLPEHYQQLASAGAVKSDGAKAILDVITENPGTNARNVAQQLGLSPGTVAYHVKRLQQAGMVQSVREGRQTLLHVVSMPYPAA